MSRFLHLNTANSPGATGVGGGEGSRSQAASIGSLTEIPNFPQEDSETCPPQSYPSFGVYAGGSVGGWRKSPAETLMVEFYQFPLPRS